MRSEPNWRSRGGLRSTTVAGDSESISVAPFRQKAKGHPLQRRWRRTSFTRSPSASSTKSRSAISKRMPTIGDEISCEEELWVVDDVSMDAVESFFCRRSDASVGCSLPQAACGYPRSRAGRHPQTRAPMGRVCERARLDEDRKAYIGCKDRGSSDDV